MCIRDRNESTQRVVSLGGRQTLSHTYHVKGLQRGYYRLGPLRLTGGDLFGLARPRLGYLPPDYLTAVSYTHLDVYKRQRWNRPCVEQWPAMTSIS